GRWDDILAAPEPPEFCPIARALRYSARAVAFAVKGQTDEARAEIERFREARARVPAEAMVDHNKASDILNVAEQLVLGEVLYREGKSDESIEHLREAVRIEDSLRYAEPPDWIQPTRHALGAVLMQCGRYKEAEQVYRDDLVRLPNNGWSLFGLSRSLEVQGKNEEAKAIRARFEEVWKDADVELSSSCFCIPVI